MNSICIIGAGEGGVNFIKEVRKLNSDISLKLIDKRDKYFKRKDVFSYWASLSKLEVISLDGFCKEYSVEFIQAKVERINPNTKRIFLKDSPSIEFDTLIIASGLSSKDISIKGDFKGGFYYLSDISPIEIKDYLKISSDILIYTSTSLGLQLVLFLSLLQKEIKLIADNLDFLGSYKERFYNLFKEKNIDVYCGVSVEEIIGETLVKAVRISLPKVFSSQLVFVDSGFSPNRNFFDEEVTPRNVFFSPYRDIYFLGDVNSLNIDKEYFFIDNFKETQIQAVSLAKMLILDIPCDYTRHIADASKKEKYLEQLLQTITLRP